MLLKHKVNNRRSSVWLKWKIELIKSKCNENRFRDKTWSIWLKRASCLSELHAMWWKVGLCITIDSNKPRRKTKWIHVFMRLFLTDFSSWCSIKTHLGCCCLVVTREQWQVWGRVCWCLSGSALGASLFAAQAQGRCRPSAGAASYQATQQPSLSLCSAMQPWGMSYMCSTVCPVLPVFFHKLITTLCCLALPRDWRGFTHCPTCGTVHLTAAQSL